MCGPANDLSTVGLGTGEVPRVQSPCREEATLRYPAPSKGCGRLSCDLVPVQGDNGG